ARSRRVLVHSSEDRRGLCRRRSGHLLRRASGGLGETQGGRDAGRHGTADLLPRPDHGLQNPAARQIRAGVPGYGDRQGPKVPDAGNQHKRAWIGTGSQVGRGLVLQIINTMTFVASIFGSGEARRGSIPRSEAVTEGATKPEPKSDATLRAA